jgi:hypothetical protein|tara:strand:- start:278 stop:922 length:645 start_codon:yes stop_codon:yes gene_type:complete
MENMDIHHLFIFTNNIDDLIQELLTLGFKEGSNRVHKGQGTSNRKIYFENFFIELIYISNEQEIKKDICINSGLTRRAYYKQNQASPFGICLFDKKKFENLFKNAYKYKPEYLPDNMEIDVLSFEDNPTLPWTFKWKGLNQVNNRNEPLTHDNNIKELTSITFGIKNKDAELIKLLKDSANFKISDFPYVKLCFDENKQNKAYSCKFANLIIEY